MKTGYPDDIIYKEVVIIGNGPSGIALSYMLSGNIPYLTSTNHPDEMLSMRLESDSNKCLLKRDLRHLATGLEGRSSNPISLLFDTLLKPCADIGLEMEPMLEFRKKGVQIDHVVLGKGPPGGSWHKMDPEILTLSLGSWMALPGYPFVSNDSGEKRALARTVANYYIDYVKTMNLEKYFNNNAIVRNVNELKSCSPIDDVSIPKLRCRKIKHGCKRPRDTIFCPADQSPDRKSRMDRRDRSVSFTYYCDLKNTTNGRCDDDETFNLLRNSYSLDFHIYSNLTNNNNNNNQTVPLQRYSCTKLNEICDERIRRKEPNWQVEATDAESGETIRYHCKYVVLANGISDVPNRLEFSGNSKDPSWLFHDLRSLEYNLDSMVPNEVDPILVVGAGLSAADAIIAIRGRNLPVVHVFRNKLADLKNKLPENMYPEYHKVHQMMEDGGSSYPNYEAYPEFSLDSFDEDSHVVILNSKQGQRLKIRVSYAVVLIGSRPDLSFFSQDISGTLIKKSRSKNALQIDKMTHLMDGFDNLFAIGPLAGDNFVRFIPGGAFAVLCEIYKNNPDYYLTV